MKRNSAASRAREALALRYAPVFPFGIIRSHPAREYARRRAQLLASLGSFAVLRGLPREPGTEETWIYNQSPIWQEPALLHFTGVNQPGVILLLDPHGREKEILFVPRRDPKKERWDGDRFSFSPASRGSAATEVREIQALTGIAAVRPVEDFKEFFLNRVRRCPKDFAGTVFHDYPKGTTPRSPRRFLHLGCQREFQRQLTRGAATVRPGFNIRNLAPLAHQLRLPLDPLRVGDAREAVRITGEALLETMVLWNKFRTEGDLALFLENALRRRTPHGLSFPIIAAGGANARILHYRKNNAPLGKHDLILLDFGARYGEITADISRTIPRSGRFTYLQSLLYDLVLETQEENRQNAVPGNTVREMNRRAWAFLARRLRLEFFRRGGSARLPYQGRPHGISHLIGLYVHEGDPFRLYQDEPLRPGWLLSNEPGLYGTFRLRHGGRDHEETLGIRIEDDMLVGPATGARTLGNIPSGRAALEALLLPPGK